jgi:starch synthase
MNILFVSSEVAPFAKSGGLGDVAGALPRQLHAFGHDVRVVLPLYPRVRAPGRVFHEVARNVDIQLGPTRVRFSIYRSDMPGAARDDGTPLPVYFIHCPGLFDRPSLYGQAKDEHVRFATLCWAAFKTCQHVAFAPDIMHINDWQTSLIPLLLRTRFSWDKLFEKTKTVLTLHNIGHQGTFPASVLPETGLADSAHLFHQEELKAGRLGFLVTGLLYADAITTVSPTYAKEIQTPEQGVRLDSILRQRRDVLSGILNGIDETEWNPEADHYLPASFSAKSLEGKEVCKRALLQTLKLPYRPEVPVIGLVSRLVWQKGLDLVVDVMPHLLMQHRFQLVVLGKGEPRYEDFFRTLHRAFPNKVHFDSAFNESRAHLIEAGADMFLMPSRYEPCGLNQMYSLRYGTVPIVHKTGGLADTVWPFDERSGHGTGFVFEHFTDQGLAWGIREALRIWGSGSGKYRERWQHLQRNGMSLPFGWRHRVGRYVDIYRGLVPTASMPPDAALKDDAEDVRA